MRNLLIDLPEPELLAMLRRQITHLFTFDGDQETESLSTAVSLALDACAHAFAKSTNKYYQREGQPRFNPFQSAQYTIFLYWVSRFVWEAEGEQRRSLADRVYYLNKALNGLDLFYEVVMPRVFFLDHPVGSVIGRAEIGEGFSFRQSCTVGNNRGVFPRIGENVQMSAGSMILGKCKIGKDAVLGAGAIVKDQDVPEGALVFGQSPNLIIKSV